MAQDAMSSVTFDFRAVRKRLERPDWDLPRYPRRIVFRRWGTVGARVATHDRPGAP